LAEIEPSAAAEGLSKTRGIEVAAIFNKGMSYRIIASWQPLDITAENSKSHQFKGEMNRFPAKK